AGVTLQQLGSSTLVLSGTNTYTGTTTIAAGATLQLGNGGTTGTVAGDIADAGLLRFNYSGPVTVGSSISGSGNAEVFAGTTVVTQISVINKVTVDPGATLQWGNGSGGAALAGISGVVDNGAVVMNFGTGNIGANVVFSGSGTMRVQSGTFSAEAVNT